MKHSWPSIHSMVLHLEIVYYKFHLKPINQCQCVLSSPWENKFSLSSFLRVCVCVRSVCVFLRSLLNKNQSSKKKQRINTNNFLLLYLDQRKKPPGNILRLLLLFVHTSILLMHSCSFFSSFSRSSLKRKRKEKREREHMLFISRRCLNQQTSSYS